jgi:hypothetical protein
MTTTDARPPSTTRMVLRPDRCTAHPDADEPRLLFGYHRRYLDTVKTLYGPSLSLALALEAGDHGRGVDPRVELVIPAHEDDVPVELRDTTEEAGWRRDHGERVEFEPEQARMHWRAVLIRAADEWDRHHAI